jgi:hypothetical protein
MTNRKSSPRTHLLIACIVALLAFPAAASATFQAGDTPTPATAIRHENGPAADQSAPAPTSTVTRVINVGGSSTTLPTVLASVAMGIALSGTAYLAFRLRSLPR